MKTRHLLFSCFAALASGVFALAQTETPPPDPAGDAAVTAFFKLRDRREAKPNEATFVALIKSGIGFIETYPEHSRTPAVVTALGMYGVNLQGPLAPHRITYTGLLAGVIIDERYKPDLSPAARTAILALDATAADFETRTTFSRENLMGLREKLDALAQQPGSGRFLPGLEHSYADLVTRGVGPTAGEKQLKKLLDHPDAGVAAMAHDELNLVEVRKTPYELKFTALDGKDFDFAKLRGKAVALMFWSTTNEASAKTLAAVRELHSNYRRDGFEVVAVSCDKEAAREKVSIYVRDNRLPWPVHFDGLEANKEWAAKLNIRELPTIALFDQKGYLVSGNVSTVQLESEIKRLLKIQPDAQPEAPASGGSRKKR